VGIEFESLSHKSRKRNDVAPPPFFNWSFLEPSYTWNAPIWEPCSSDTLRSIIHRLCDPGSTFPNPLYKPNQTNEAEEPRHDGHSPTNDVCPPTRLFIAMYQQTIPGISKSEFGCKRRARSAQNPPPTKEGQTGSFSKLPRDYDDRKLELANSADVAKVFRLHWEVQMLFGLRSFPKIASN